MSLSDNNEISKGLYPANQWTQINQTLKRAYVMMKHNSGEGVRLVNDIKVQTPNYINQI